MSKKSLSFSILIGLFAVFFSIAEARSNDKPARIKEIEQFDRQRAHEKTLLETNPQGLVPTRKRGAIGAYKNNLAPPTKDHHQKLKSPPVKKKIIKKQKLSIAKDKKS